MKSVAARACRSGEGVLQLRVAALSPGIPRGGAPLVQLVRGTGIPGQGPASISRLLGALRLVQGANRSRPRLRLVAPSLYALEPASWTPGSHTVEGLEGAAVVILTSNQARPLPPPRVGRVHSLQRTRTVRVLRSRRGDVRYSYPVLRVAFRSPAPRDVFALLVFDSLADGTGAATRWEPVRARARALTIAGQGPIPPGVRRPCGGRVVSRGGLPRVGARVRFAWLSTQGVRSALTAPVRVRGRSR